MSTSPLHELFDRDETDESPLHKLFREQEPSQHTLPYKKHPIEGKFGETYSKYVERPGQIALQDALAGAKSFPKEGYNFLKSLYQMAGKDPFTSAEKSVPQGVKNVLSKLPTFEETKRKGEFQNPQYAQASGPTEETVGAIGRGFGEAPYFGGVGGVRGAAGLVGGIGGAEFGKHTGLNLPGQLVTGLVGDVLAHRLTKLPQTTYRYITNPKKALAESPMFARKPNAALEEKLESFKRQGMTPNISGASGTPTSKYIEKIASTSPLTETEFKEFMGNLDDDFVKLYERTVENISPNKQFATRAESAQTLKGGIKETHDLVAEARNVAYQKVKESLPTGSSIDVHSADKIRESAVKVSDEVKSLVKSNPSSAVKDTADQLVKNLDTILESQARPLLDAQENILGYIGKEKSVTQKEFKGMMDHLKQNKNIDPKLIDQIEKNSRGLGIADISKKDIEKEFRAAIEQAQFIPIDVLEDTAKGINEIVKYEKLGGREKQLLGIKDQIEKSLDRYASSLPHKGQGKHPYLEYRDIAKKEHGYLSEMLRNDLVHSILYGERPELALQTMNTPSGIKQVEKMLERNPKGKEIVQGLKQQKFQDLFQDFLMKEGDFSYKNASSLNRRKWSEMLDALLTPAQRSDIKDLSNMADVVEKGMRTYRNPSASADTLFRVLGIFKPLSQIAKGVLTADIPQAFAGVGALVAPRVFAKLVTDKEFISLVKQANFAIKRGETKRFQTLTNRLMDYLKEDEKEPNQEG